MDIKLPVSKCKVTLKDRVPWGDLEDLEDMHNSSMVVIGETASDGKKTSRTTFDGAIMKAHKMKRIESCIEKIVNEKNEEVKFTYDWIRDLDYEDGDLISESCSKIIKDIKKK